jgi:beta-galactosidase
MIHLLPHWNWPERAGGIVPVVVYSNCVAVELFLNGKTLGVKAREFPSEGVAGAWNTYAKPKVEATTADLQLVWDVPYEAGELKAVGYYRNAEIVATTSARTAHEPASIEVTVDRAAITAAARDVAHVTVRALDSDGVFVPLANNPMTFRLDGRAKLIGIDNGDPESHSSYQSDTRAPFNGLALALVQSTNTPGTVHLVARSPGLREAAVDITTSSSN